LIAAVLLLAAAGLGAEDGTPEAPKAAELLDRAFHNLYADDYTQTLQLATRFRGGREMSRRLQVTRKQSAQPGKALVRFLEPFAIRRTSILILENDGRSDDLYVYLPAAGRTRHLSSSQRKDSFFGTDLSYEDIEPKQAADYKVSLAGLGALKDDPCVILDIRARPHFESTYEKMVSCIESERGLIYWTEFYRKGSVVKRLEVDPRDVREIGTKFIPFTMTVATPRNRSETLVLTESYELRPVIPDSLFTTWNLEAGDADRDRARAGPSE
jgi:hypothetical protein